jgi:Trp operon repressor
MSEKGQIYNEILNILEQKYKTSTKSIMPIEMGMIGGSKNSSDKLNTRLHRILRDGLNNSSTDIKTMANISFDRITRSTNNLK